MPPGKGLSDKPEGPETSLTREPAHKAEASEVAQGPVAETSLSTYPTRKAGGIEAAPGQDADLHTLPVNKPGSSTISVRPAATLDQTRMASTEIEAWQLAIQKDKSRARYISILMSSQFYPALLDKQPTRKLQARGGTPLPLAQATFS